MRNLPTAVLDNGLVRLGAGVRAPRALPLRPSGRPLERPVATQGATPQSARIPAAVADAGRIRLGAGIRRV